MPPSATRSTASTNSRDVADAVLEQVADARGVVADELEHVRRLEVLREDEHGDRRLRAADLGGGDAARRRRCPGGMRTSTIAMSGVYERTFSSRSSASPARPTTSWPASSSSDAMPSRRSALSSATTMRSGATASSVGVASVGVASCRCRWGDTGARRRRARPSARRARGRPDPRGNGSACRGLRGRARGDRRARSAGSSAPSGRSGRTTSACAASARGTRATARPEFEALSERIALARGRGPPGPRARDGRAGLDRRRARGRELPARRRRAARAACTPRSASRCGARAAWSA